MWVPSLIIKNYLSLPHTLSSLLPCSFTIIDGLSLTRTINCLGIPAATAKRKWKDFMRKMLIWSVKR